MFSQSSERTIYLLNRRPFKEDSYILYKGGMVSSNLIDIEVIMKNHPEINSKIIVDLEDNIEVLKMRIVEIVEKFPKLSSLIELAAVDLCLKTEKGLVPISDRKLENYIRARDIIYFDLQFSEIWLETEMSLNSEENNLKITFDMKVKVDSYISELKHILIKMGIKSWAKYILDDEDGDDHDYYIFSNFEMTFPDKEGKFEKSCQIELENFHEKVKDVFNFKSRISCSLKFINFNDLIYKELTHLNEEKTQRSSWLSKVDFNRKKVIKKFINEYLDKFCKYDVKNSHIATHKNMIWKWNDENILVRGSTYNLRFEEESRRDSFSDYTSSYVNAYMMETKWLCKPYEPIYLTPTNNGIFKGSNLKLNYKTHAKFDSKYTKDFNQLQNIDCFQLINKHSGAFFSNLEFDSVYLPDTKNLKKISRENSFSIKKTFDEKISRNSDFFGDNNGNLKFKYKHSKIKNSHVIILFLVVFILFIWIFY